MSKGELDIDPDYEKELIRAEQKLLNQVVYEKSTGATYEKRGYSWDRYDALIKDYYDPPRKTITTKHEMDVNGSKYHKRNVNALIRELKQSYELEDNWLYKLSRGEFLGSFDVDDRVWLYTPIDLFCVLAPEPENKHDPNAISVWVSSRWNISWKDVGYIPRWDTSVAVQLIENGTPVIAELYGGKYRTVKESSSYDLYTQVVDYMDIKFKIKWD